MRRKFSTWKNFYKIKINRTKILKKFSFVNLVKLKKERSKEKYGCRRQTSTERIWSVTGANSGKSILYMPEWPKEVERSKILFIPKK